MGDASNRMLAPLLGADENTRMFLNKPCYGQIDAPRRWYLEAVRRLKSLGFRQHLLDPCCFLLYEEDFEDGKANPTMNNTLGDQRLCGLVCIHVADLLGAGNTESVVYNRVVDELKKTFNFREWKESKDQETCKLEAVSASLLLEVASRGILQEGEAHCSRKEPIP